MNIVWLSLQNKYHRTKINVIAPKAQVFLYVIPCGVRRINNNCHRSKSVSLLVKRSSNFSRKQNICFFKKTNLKTPGIFCRLQKIGVTFLKDHRLVIASAAKQPHRIWYLSPCHCELSEAIQTFSKS